jgi:phosphomannomutase
MHGVGRKWMERAWLTFGHPPFYTVPEQADPDPTFPTVAFPNPEEKGALDRAMAFATEHNCSLILANDPDADRLAVAELLPNVEGPDAKPVWHAFSGNEIGVLLGYWQILKWSQKQAPGQAAVLASIVSSRMLRAIAKAEGVLYNDTLTGFKWLGNRAQDLRAQGVDVLFTYEEALGYCVGDMLCDKDGVSAASVFMEMVSELSAGWTDPSASHTMIPITSAYQLLNYLNHKYGLFVSYNSYVISRDPRKTDEIFAKLRATGPTGGYWTHSVGQKIVSIQDITMGYDSSSPDLKSSLPLTPDSHMIMFEFENGVSVTLRTSGTEPKIKFYTEIAGSADQSKDVLRLQLKTFVDALVDEMLDPVGNGLQRA